MNNKTKLTTNLFSKENLLLYAAIIVSLTIVFFPVNYGYFCDELYSIALSKNLAFGYTEVPPLMPFLLAITRKLFGESCPQSMFCQQFLVL